MSALKCLPSNVCPQLLSALNCLPSTTVCPQLLFALNCLPSNVCPQLSALNYCLPSTNARAGFRTHMHTMDEFTQGWDKRCKERYNDDANIYIKELLELYKQAQPMFKYYRYVLLFACLNCLPQLFALYCLPPATVCLSQLFALNYCLPSTSVCFNYCLPSTTICPQLLSALNCSPSTTVCPQLLSALNCCLPSTTVCPQLFALN